MSTMSIRALPSCQLGDTVASTDRQFLAIVFWVGDPWTRLALATVKETLTRRGATPREIHSAMSKENSAFARPRSTGAPSIPDGRTGNRFVLDNDKRTMSRMDTSAMSPSHRIPVTDTCGDVLGEAQLVICLGKHWPRVAWDIRLQLRARI